jgi:hypothetical protein
VRLATFLAPDQTAPLAAEVRGERVVALGDGASGSRAATARRPRAPTGRWRT